MTSLEIWIYQDGRPVVRHSAAHACARPCRRSRRGRDLLDEAMNRAMADVQAGRLAVAPTLAKTA